MRRVLLIALAVLVLVLGACDGEEDDAPELSAPPTRTPAPPTPTPASTETAQPAANSLRVVSLYSEVDAFLNASESVSALDRVDLLDEYLFDPAAECFESNWWVGVAPQELFSFNVVSLNLEFWRAGADIFPASALEAEITDALTLAMDRWPPLEELVVCVVPLPYIGTPEGQENGGLTVRVNGSNRVFIGCAAGEYCLDHVLPEMLYAYGFLLQIGLTGQSAFESTFLEHIVFSGRADEFARQLVEPYEMRWIDALTPDQIGQLWDRILRDRDLTPAGYGNARDLTQILYGGQNQNRFPTWGGLYIGDQIVRSYRAAHPEASLEALFALDAATLLEESGYAPQ